MAVGWGARLLHPPTPHHTPLLPSLRCTWPGVGCDAAADAWLRGRRPWGHPKAVATPLGLWAPCAAPAWGAVQTPRVSTAGENNPLVGLCRCFTGGRSRAVGRVVLKAFQGVGPAGAASQPPLPPHARPLRLFILINCVITAQHAFVTLAFSPPHPPSAPCRASRWLSSVPGGVWAPPPPTRTPRPALCVPNDGRPGPDHAPREPGYSPKDRDACTLPNRCMNMTSTLRPVLQDTSK
jgi:hypothetical protein